MKNYAHGHEIELDTITGEWYYRDTKEPVFGSNRACVRCGALPTENGHDACIANLPNVRAACCGHGKSGAYVMYNDGRLIYWPNPLP